MRLPFLAALVLLAGCQPARVPELAAPADWPSVQQTGKGQTVTWAMWMGDPLVNTYVREFVVPAVRERYGVNLVPVDAQGNAIVSALMTEKEAGKAVSDYDLLWINGETFYQLRQIGALHGPFTQLLPNSRYVDQENPFINLDFQQPVAGFESPWGNVQFTLIHDPSRANTSTPPRSRADLYQWVKDHPGRFTFDNSFTGLTFLKCLLCDIAGGGAALDGKFNEAEYLRHSATLWAELRDIKPSLWKQGRTFPEGVAQLHQLFASGEVDFTMSNNDGEVDNKALQRVLPDTSRAYVPDFGTIQNSHYLGIPARSAHKEAAMLVADFLLSPEAQYEKLKPAVWGDGTVLAVAKLPPDWQEKFRHVPGRDRAPAREEIQPRALKELAPEYMIRLNEDFRREILEK